MRNKIFFTPLLAILIFAVTIVSCKKQSAAELQPATLENTTWIFTTEIWFFQNGNLETFTRNSVWTFSSNHKLKIFNPNSYIREERGEWNRTADNKIIVNINNDDLWHYARSYKIITETNTYMRLEFEHRTGESTGNGKTSKIHYELIRL